VGGGRGAGDDEEAAMAELRWSKVLCPVDFSDESRAALRAAADLSRRMGAALTLFHAESAESELRAAAAPGGLLADWRREAERLGVARVTAASAPGQPATAIVEAATGGGFDLIVMGTHGRTGRRGALLGSVAESVVRSSRVPVLTVHADWLQLR
jgi:nucleotide-binding universal stress UspA family protein